MFELFLLGTICKILIKPYELAWFKFIALFLYLGSSICNIAHLYAYLWHRYRITEGVNLPFRVLPTIKELGRTRMEVNVKVGWQLGKICSMCWLSRITYVSHIFRFQVKSVFGAKMFALGVVIKIPVPKQTAKTSFQVTSGRAKYNASLDCLVWKWVSEIFEFA